MRPLAILRRIIALPDLRRRIGLVFFLLVITRVLTIIPLPGININQIADFFQQNQALSLLNLFTGGGLSNVSFGLMGVGPYITASIIIQLLGYTVPAIEEMQKEGEMGRKRLSQYTRLLTVPLGLMQGFGTLTLLRNSGLIQDWGPAELLLMLVVATAGTVTLMWLGELISEHGVGNGISLIITLGILANVTTAFSQTSQLFALGGEQVTNLLLLGGLGIITLAVVIMVTEGVRNVPVTYARSVRGSGMLGQVSSVLPIKINMAGVIPIIFAVSLVIFPSIVAQFFQNSDTAWLAQMAEFILRVFNQQHWFYSVFYFALVFGFTYFYTFIIVKPEEMAENLQHQGGFIPGVRPGTDTARFIYNVVNRLTFPGALFLAVIAVLPIIMQNITGITTISLGGTSILIVVSVTLETIRQVQAQIATRTYEEA